MLIQLSFPGDNRVYIWRNTPHVVDKRISHASEPDFDPVTILKRPSAAERELHRTEEINMHVTGHAKLWVLEMMVLQIRQRMAHVFLAGEKLARIVDHIFPTVNSAGATDVLERLICDEFRPDSARPQFGGCEPQIINSFHSMI